MQTYCTKRLAARWSFLMGRVDWFWWAREILTDFYRLIDELKWKLLARHHAREYQFYFFTTQQNLYKSENNASKKLGLRIPRRGIEKIFEFFILWNFFLSGVDGWTNILPRFTWVLYSWQAEGSAGELGWENVACVEGAGWSSAPVESQKLAETNHWGSERTSDKVMTIIEITITPSLFFR